MKNHEDDCERKRRGLSLGKARATVLLAGLLGVLTLSGGVFAAWSPTSSMGTGAYNAATLAVAMVDANGTTFTTGVSNLLPGDYLNRYADLSNTGTVAQTFSGTVAGTGLLTAAMTVQVDSCSVSWSANGTCSGTTSSVKAETATSSSVPFAFASMAPNEVKHARFRYKLIDTASQATYQGAAGSQQVTIVGSATVAGGQDRTAG